jgi:hypothetical protein
MDHLPFALHAATVIYLTLFALRADTQENRNNNNHELEITANMAAYPSTGCSPTERFYAY